MKEELIKEKVCKHCGTKENLILDKRGYTWQICITCKSNQMSKLNVGDKNPNFGKTHTYETKQKISKINKGRIHTNETLIKMSDSRKGDKNPMYGKHHNVATIEKIRTATKGKIISEETKVKMSISHIGLIKSEETRIKLSNATKGEKHHLYGKQHSTKTLYKMSKSQKGKILTNEHKQKIRDSNLGKIRSHATCIKLSESRKFTLKDYQKKYPWFFLFEEMREIYDKSNKLIIQVKCKKCNEWFVPGIHDISNRIVSLNNNKDNSYFYCSNKCKNSCPLFNLNVNNFLNNLNHQSNNPIQSTPEYQTFRKEVFHRQILTEDIQINHCERCNSIQDLHVHHEHPIKTHPHLSLDPDNAIILCSSCHYSIGHKDECSTGALANKICNKIYQEAI